jgi:hypothetical protein
MARRDYRRREPKKPKRGAKKTEILSELLGPTETEVIRKKRKPSTEE